MKLANQAQWILTDPRRSLLHSRAITYLQAANAHHLELGLGETSAGA
jgi:hypothetical protein